MGDPERGGEANRSPTRMAGPQWGRLAFTREGGRTVASRVFATSPLKFMVPTKVAAAAVDAVWVYMLQYGGGIVAGDVISFRVDVGAACTAVLTTQASSKVYHSNGGKVSQQIMEVTLAAGSLFALLPDPVTPFARSQYVQSQTFHLKKDASLLLVDWMTSGRRQRDEVWGFSAFETANRVFLDGKPVLLDKLRLENGRGLTVMERMAGAHVLGLMLLIGPRVKETMQRLEQQLPVRGVALQKSRALAAARERALESETPSGTNGASGGTEWASGGMERASGGKDRASGGTGGTSRELDGSFGGRAGSSVRVSGGLKEMSGRAEGSSSGTAGPPRRTSGGPDGRPESRPKAESADASVQGLLSLSFSKVAGGEALVVRFVAGTTDAAYDFLREQLGPLTAQLGSRPYPG